MLLLVPFYILPVAVHSLLTSLTASMAGKGFFHLPCLIRERPPAYIDVLMPNPWAKVVAVSSRVKLQSRSPSRRFPPPTGSYQCQTNNVVESVSFVLEFSCRHEADAVCVCFLGLTRSRFPCFSRHRTPTSSRLAVSYTGLWQTLAVWKQDSWKGVLCFIPVMRETWAENYLFYCRKWSNGDNPKQRNRGNEATMQKFMCTVYRVNIPHTNVVVDRSCTAQACSHSFITTDSIHLWNADSRM